MKNAWGLLKNIKDYGKRDYIENRLHQQGGWRAFFDTISHQWTLTAVNEKVDFLHEIMQAANTTLEEIVDLYKKDYGSDRPDIVLRVESALEILRDHAARERPARAL